MKKLYIGNLAYSTSEEGLKAFFAEYAPTSARIITDKFTQQSRGFGFIEIDDSARADAAIAELDGKTLDGKQLKINEARPQESRGGGFDGPRGGGRRDFNGGGNGGGRSERRNNW